MVVVADLDDDLDGVGSRGTGRGVVLLEVDDRGNARCLGCFAICAARIFASNKYLDVSLSWDAYDTDTLGLIR